MGGMIRRCRVGQQFRLSDGTVVTVVSIKGRREVKLHVASPRSATEEADRDNGEMRIDSASDLQEMDFDQHGPASPGNGSGLD